MKHFILALLTVLTICTGAKGTNRTEIAYDSTGRKQTIVVNDTNINGRTVIDTLSITTEVGHDADTGHEEKWHHRYEFDSEDISEIIVALTAIVLIFGMPIFILFIIFYFRYKNRKAQYRLIEKSLASGHPLPDTFYKKAKMSKEDLRSKGIRKCCLGIGLFIFFDALTNTYAISCIGMIILLNGIGELLIYYTRPKTPKDSDSNTLEQEKE